MAAGVDVRAAARRAQPAPGAALATGGAGQALLKPVSRGGVQPALPAGDHASPRTVAAGNLAPVRRPPAVPISARDSAGAEVLAASRHRRVLRRIKTPRAA